MAEQRAAQREQVRQLFNAKAATWSAKYAADGRLARRLTGLAAALRAHAPAAALVLDLGCGTGELASAAAAGGMRVTAADISPEMLRRAADGDPGGVVEWLLLPPGWRVLPFGTASFDAVVAASVLEYLDSPLAVLGECARVLRPGGVALCTVPRMVHPVRWLEWLARGAARGRAVRAPTGRGSRLQGYLTYLRISRQRHSLRWWRAAAAQAGLCLLPPVAADRPTLRLLIFRRPERPAAGA